MIWHIVLVSANLAVALLATLKLALWHAKLNTLERYGLGLLGAGVVMTTGPVLILEGPFDQWAPLLFRIGVLVLMTGHVLRYRKTGVSR